MIEKEIMVDYSGMESMQIEADNLAEVREDLCPCGRDALWDDGPCLTCCEESAGMC